MLKDPFLFKQYFISTFALRAKKCMLIERANRIYINLKRHCQRRKKNKSEQETAKHS